MHLELLGGTLTAGELRDLTTLLADCVNDGASIGFLAPLPEAEAEAETYWRKVATEVQKVMVRPTHRRRGIAAALMALVEAAARDRWVRLLFLDTSEGRGGAVQFYERLGYTYVGGIPGYALDPDGTPAKNAIYYKTLAPGA